MSEQNRDTLRRLRLAGIACAVFLLDQVSKFAVAALLPRGGRIGPPVMHVALTPNYGGVFGLFQGAGRQLLIASAVVLLILIALAWRSAGRSTFTDFALALAIGGASGNLLDRARLGYVRDFVHIGPWPAFNVADAVIVAAVCLFVAAGFRRRGD